MDSENKKRKLEKSVAKEETSDNSYQIVKKSNITHMEENFLLLSTTYDLNYTKGKRIDVGLEKNADFTYSVCIRIIRAGSGEVITMNDKEWEIFKTHMNNGSIFKKCGRRETIVFQNRKYEIEIWRMVRSKERHLPSSKTNAKYVRSFFFFE